MKGCIIQSRPDETFSIGDVEVEPFHISHDAADPVAYRFESNGKVPQLPQTWEFITIT